MQPVGLVVGAYADLDDADALPVLHVLVVGRAEAHNWGGREGQVVEGACFATDAPGHVTRTRTPKRFRGSRRPGRPPAEIPVSLPALPVT